MWSVCCCSSFHAVVAPPPFQHHTRTLLFNKRTSSSTKLNNLSSCHHPLHSSLKDDSSSSTPKQSQVGYDAAEELYGLDVDIPPRDAKSDSSEPRSWFGPNGQYIRELPCPNCRGRGYTPCVECGIERSRTDCLLCSGKGIMTCHRCSGECVIWEESIDEIPWEKARSSSPLKVKDDDEVDNLDLKLDVRKKSKRVYRSTPEVGLKISRSLKSLNAKTGLFSKRMKIIHKDPTLHAQRVAAIKKTKRTAAARKQASEALKTFFSNPENRRRRSISMKGTKFFCKKCGKEGHRSHLCPEHGENIDRRLRCRLCGERGHNRKTCGRPSKPKRRILQQYHCGACRQVGHNRRTCSVKAEFQLVDAVTKDGSSLDMFSSHVKADEDSVDDDTIHGNSSDESTSPRTRYPYHCRACGQIGHNRRTCSVKPESEPQSVNALTKNGKFSDESSSLMKPERNSAGAFTENGTPFTDSVTKVRQPYRCRRCEQLGHNARTCPQKSAEQANVIVGKRARRRPYHCRNCGLIGHNHRTCHVANPKPLNSEC